MIIDLGSFAFGSNIKSGGGTPSWGTSIGQSSPDYKITRDGAESILIGMLYCSVPLETINLPIGKGGHVYKASERKECQLASLFKKTYINGIQIDYPFVMLLLKEESGSHPGRKSIKYSDKNEYQNGSEHYINQEFIVKARTKLGLSDDACWFVYKIEVRNQDELHFFAVIVDAANNVIYEDSSIRKGIWTRLIPDADYIDSFVHIGTFEGQPLQQIFYGAPGTGKSHEIKEKTKGDATVVRTTFHPDSDYSTFVGCYKPTMSEKPKPIYGFDATGKTVKVDEERKIEYKFIQQAFTKAYIKAWKKMDDYHPIYRTFYVGSTKYDIIGISGDLVRVKASGSEDSAGIEIRKSELDDVFKTKDSHDEIGRIRDDNDEPNRNKGLWKNPNEPWQNNPNEVELDPSDIDKIKEGFGDILPHIGKSFDEAWDVLEKEGLKPQYLIIEEINRGNCAQIFGDLFQLLDRGDFGYSEYPIEADEDLRKELEREFDKLDLSLLKYEIDSIFKENYPKGITDKIKSGELLVLPRNLFIWATMNTSDQSLFPIDSAFKRRWEWKYQPIVNTNKDWKIKIDGYEPIDWWKFIERINKVIFDLTSSEDKQLGYFFCKPESKEKTTISAKRFVEKVIFYLWNDVFKDYSYDPECCNKKDSKEEKVKYSDFYSTDGKDINTDVLANFINQLKTKDGKESPLAIKE